MKKQMVCPNCQAVNDVEDAAVGCYVLCRNCPHRFYVPVPPLGEGLADEPPPPNVVPDYKAWEQRWTSRAQDIEALAAEMRWQRTILLALFAAQVVTGLMVLVLLVWLRG
jgi:hypothetical protein